MRTSFTGVLTGMLIAAAASLLPAPAHAGTVVVKVDGAEAIVHEDDTVFGTGQDFYPRISYLGGPLAEGPIKDGKDVATWDPGGFLLSKTVPNTVRTVNVQVSLFDDDDTSGDDLFDINPGSGSPIDLLFDTCTMTWTAPGVAGPQGPGPVSGGVVGTGPDPARMEFEVLTSDRRPFTTNDVAISQVRPVQAVLAPTRIVAGKPLALRVDLVSTYGAAITAPVTVTLKDNSTGGDRSETRSITVPPAGVAVYFFDGTGSEPPYVPGRNASNAFLEFDVHVDFPETAPPGTDPKFLDCYVANNSVAGRRVPIVATRDPLVVYQRWDWQTSEPVPIAPASWISAADLTAFRNQEETFRAAAWPLASLNPANRAAPEIGSTSATVYADSFYASLNGTLARAGAAASVAGIDRLVLVARNGWFADNDAAGAPVPDAIGISLSEASPHAVITEHGFNSIAAHELGHTFRLSRHSCSTGGLAEGVLEHGCRDEYNHATSDGRVYPGIGMDLNGTIYPAGFSSTGTTCPPMVAGTREVCGRSVMDSTPSGYFDTWLDKSATESLTTDLKSPGDPELINLTGWVHVAGGLDGATTRPFVFDGGLVFAYHFDGVPDLPKPLLSGPSAWSGPFSGGGPFAVRLNTGQGNFTYRFTPEFRIEGQDLEIAWFSFNVPWDPSVHQIDLYVPSDVEHLDCETPPCDNDDVLAFSRPRTVKPPVVTTVRAGLDVTPELAGPQPDPPGIGPGHDVVLAWSMFDDDSPTLHSAVLIDQAPGSGGPRGWVPMDLEISGNTLRIPHDRLQDSPGEYIARVVVSDGVNSATFTTPDKIFRICNFTNGGVEICDGLDNDCDGETDETPLIHNQPILSVESAGLSWTPRCFAPGYDVAYGKVSLLRSSGDFRDAACLANSVPDTTLPFTTTPDPGQAYWFLVRVSHETWNDGTEAADRDLSLLVCP